MHIIILKKKYTRKYFAPFYTVSILHYFNTLLPRLLFKNHVFFHEVLKNVKFSYQ